MSAELTELADGVFAWLHTVNERFTCNVGVIVEGDSLSLIDSSGVPSSYQALAHELKRFNRPVQRIFLTHAHGDHVAGVKALLPSDVICSNAAADELRKPFMLQAYQRLHPTIAAELVSLQLPVPTQVIERSQTFGRLDIRLFEGHTGGDLAISVADAGVAFVGDLCSFGHVPLGIDARFDCWIAALQSIKQMGACIVPGHGSPGNRADVECMQEYLSAILSAARTHTSLRAGPWSDWHDPWTDRIPNAVHQINIEHATDPTRPPPTLMKLIFGEPSSPTG
jgi:cyclase